MEHGGEEILYPIIHLVFKPIYLNVKILSNKAGMGVRLQKAYKQREKEVIRACINQLGTLYIDIKVYYKAIRKQWAAENKMSGLEVQDQRMGGIK